MTISFFITHEIFHLLIGLTIGLLAFLAFKEKKYLLISIIFSLGLDIDHLVDYFNYFGFRIVNPVTGADFFCLSGKLFVPFHGWEYLVILLLGGIFFRKIRRIFLIAFFCLLGHLLLDQFSYNMYPLSYSIIFRLVNNFDINKISWGCRSSF